MLRLGEGRIMLGLGMGVRILGSIDAHDRGEGWGVREREMLERWVGERL